MIKSMTAFGRAEKTAEGSSYTVEMRCVNRRYCEISVRMLYGGDALREQALL
jgi:uncharacterized protein YicC (UPF0701 family)